VRGKCRYNNAITSQKKGQLRMTNQNANALWEEMDRKRQAKKMTLAKTARAIGYRSHSSLVQIQEGDTGNLTGETYKAIADFVDKPVETVLRMAGILEASQGDEETQQLLHQLNRIRERDPQKYAFYVELVQTMARESAT